MPLYLRKTISIVGPIKDDYETEDILAKLDEIDLVFIYKTRLMEILETNTLGDDWKVKEE